jgi:hypothetical protein
MPVESRERCNGGVTLNNPCISHMEAECKPVRGGRSARPKIRESALAVRGWGLGSWDGKLVRIRNSTIFLFSLSAKLFSPIIFRNRALGDYDDVEAQLNGDEDNAQITTRM